MADQQHTVQVENVPASKGGGDSDSTTGKWDVGRFLQCVLDWLKLIFNPFVSLSEMLSRLTAMSYGVALTITMLLGLLVVYADGIRGFCFLTWIIILITSDGLRGMAALNLIVLLFITFT